jgi:PIN domain nuclease of toxin-antitoxin system
VNVLLDAHALLWFLDDDPLLSGTAKKLIEDPSNPKFVSVAT